MKYTVKASNVLSGRSFGASFRTEAEATAWLQEMQNKQSWGKTARQAIRGQDNFDESLVLSEFEDVNEDGETRTIVSLKPEYTFTGPTLVDGTGATEEDKSFRIEQATGIANQVNKKREQGKTVASYFSGLISARGLTKAQKKQIRKDAAIKSVLAELELGALEDALVEIKAITVDNVIYFQSDVNAIEQLINDFIGV